MEKVSSKSTPTSKSKGQSNKITIHMTATEPPTKVKHNNQMK